MFLHIFKEIFPEIASENRKMMPERVSTGQVFFSRCGRMGVGGLRCVIEITSLSYNIVTECFLTSKRDYFPLFYFLLLYNSIDYFPLLYFLLLYNSIFINLGEKTDTSKFVHLGFQILSCSSNLVEIPLKLPACAIWPEFPLKSSFISLFSSALKLIISQQ